MLALFSNVFRFRVLHLPVVDLTPASCTLSSEPRGPHWGPWVGWTPRGRWRTPSWVELELMGGRSPESRVAQAGLLRTEP